MEAPLIDSWLEEISPFDEIFFVIIEEFQFVSKTLKFETERVKGFFFLLCWVFEEKFEDEVEVKGNFVGEGFVGLNKMIESTWTWNVRQLSKSFTYEFLNTYLPATKVKVPSLRGGWRAFSECTWTANESLIMIEEYYNEMRISIWFELLFW